MPAASTTELIITWAETGRSNRYDRVVTDFEVRHRIRVVVLGLRDALDRCVIGGDKHSLCLWRAHAASPIFEKPTSHDVPEL